MHTTNSPRPHRRWPLSLFLSLTVALALAGCGGVDTVDDPGKAVVPESTQAAEFPVDVLSGPMDGGSPITIEQEPTSIVSLSPTATEMLWEVGAGDQVVAVDDQSNHPRKAPRTKLSGYEPNVEAILEHEPDLVVAADDTGDLVANLEKARVPTLVLPSATGLEETYSQIERVGEATGHQDEAEQVVSDMRDRVETALAEAPDAKGLSYFHELTPDLYTASGSTFIGEVYAMFGLENIADESPTKDAYPQLNGEYVVGADPDLVFLADSQCCGVSAQDVGNRPGWGRMTAVTDQQVHVVNADVASRWGPRVVDFVEQISRVLTEREQQLAGG